MGNGDNRRSGEAARRVHATVAVNVLPDSGGHGTGSTTSPPGHQRASSCSWPASANGKGRPSFGAYLWRCRPTGEPDPSVPTVGATNWSGAYAATRHLAELGHRGSRLSQALVTCSAAMRAWTATARQWRRPACLSTPT